MSRPQRCVCRPCIVLRGRAGEYSGIEMERLKLITFDALENLKQGVGAQCVAYEAMKKIVSRCCKQKELCCSNEAYDLYGVCVLDACGNFCAADSCSDFNGSSVCSANCKGAVSVAVCNNIIKKYNLTHKILNCQDSTQILSMLNVIASFECGPVGAIAIDSCGKVNIYTPRICMIWVYATPQTWNMGCSRPLCVDRCVCPTTTLKCCKPRKPCKPCPPILPKCDPCKQPCLPKCRPCKPCKPCKPICRPGKPCQQCRLCCPGDACCDPCCIPDFCCPNPCDPCCQPPPSCCPVDAAYPDPCCPGGPCDSDGCCRVDSCCVLDPCCPGLPNCF